MIRFISPSMEGLKVIIEGGLVFERVITTRAIISCMEGLDVTIEGGLVFEGPITGSTKVRFQVMNRRILSML
jgi:hypothetical protein